MTKYFPYKEEYIKTSYLNTIVVYFGSMIMREKSKFRIRLFKKDVKTGKPSNDIIKEDVIASSRKINGKVKIDISRFDVEFPEEGFFYWFRKNSYAI